MKTRRGSAALYVMVMLIIMTGVTLAYASISNDAYTSQTRREQAVIAKLAFDGATLKSAYDAGLANVAVTSYNTETVGHYTCYVNMSDNSMNLAHSVSLSSTLSINNRTYVDSRVMALKMPESQFFYSVALNSSTPLSKSLITGSSGTNGDIYCNGSISFHPGSTVNGDLECTTTANTSHATITGQVANNALQIPLPTPSNNSYSSVATWILTNFIFGNTISGWTFTVPYSVLYCWGNTTINGTLQGKGIIYVRGNLEVTNDLTYTSPTDEVAFIVTGNVTVDSAAGGIVGYWDCENTFQTSSTLTMSRGCIVTQGLSLGGTFTPTYDPIIWNTPGEAANMKLPGFWP